MYIPYGTQSISEEDIQAVVKVLRSDYLTTGPVEKNLKKKWQNIQGQNTLWRFQVAQLHSMQHVLQQV